MVKAIVNLGEGIYLDVKDITSFSIKEIQVNAQGDMCFALVCYPGPGAGYVVSRYNDEKLAHKWFESLLTLYTEQAGKEVFYVESKYEEPKKKEAEVIGKAALEVVPSKKK